MTAIQTGQFSAVLSEGAAVRLNSHIAQSGEDETHVYFTPCDDAKAVVLPPQSVRIGALPSALRSTRSTTRAVNTPAAFAP